MNIHLITDYSPWHIALCLLIGALYSYFLYHKDKWLEAVPSAIKWLMILARFVVVSALALLLLNPLVKTLFRKLEKPIVILALDNSESVLLNKDSLFYKTEYKKQVSQLIESISEPYDVQVYSFGNTLADEANYEFNEKQTNFSNVFEELNARYSNRNVGAIVIASDGLYNEGMNPMYAPNQLKAPLYTVALGDTTVRKDLIIANVQYNHLAYLGNQFPVEITIQAKQCKGEDVQISITKGKTTSFVERIKIDNDNYIHTIPLQLEAKGVGIQHYVVRLSALEDEISQANNVQHIFIDVIDDRQKILLLAQAPHPDIAAIKQAIETNENYEVDISFTNTFSGNIEAYNLAILYQLPDKSTPNLSLIKKFSEGNVPLLFCVGSSTAINPFNTVQNILTIKDNKERYNEALSFFNKDFSTFTISDDLRQYIVQLPPLLSPFGDYTYQQSSSVLLYQKIGAVETNQPMILFNTIGNKKIGVIAGEGLWKWRLNDYLEHQNHEIFNELINKTIQYLALKEDKSQFRVACNKRFLENESLIFNAEVYNDNYELINVPDVSIDIVNQEEKKFSFVMSKTAHSYFLNAGTLPVGEYQYVAKTKLGEKILIEKGELSIAPIQVEQIQTTANHNLLYQLAKKYDGEMLNVKDMNELSALLENRKDMKPLIYNKQQLKEVIHIKWIFLLLLLLLSMEWFLRKRNGAY